MSKGLNFLLKEKDEEQEKEVPTYEDLLTEVNLLHEKNEIDANNINNDLIALEIDYQTNYTKKDLDKIAEYYGLNKRKKKLDLVEEIVQFENDIQNIELVYKRKKMWNYINEIKSDKYLSRYLIFD